MSTISVAQFTRHDIALVTGALHHSPTGGRALLSRLNHDAMAALFGDALLVIEIQSRGLTGWEALRASFTGHLDGLDYAVIARVVEQLQGAGVSKVVIDGSNLGKLAAEIRRKCPDVEVITFFHNCEARFFLGSLRQRFSVRACGVLLANYLAERAAVRFSQKRICLNERDSRLLFRVYGQGATHLAPMAMHDMLPPNSQDGRVPQERYALFVGGNFYANRQGIDWFVDNVARQAPLVTYVVGQGFEECREKLERNGNVKVIGPVENLAPWYLDAQVVIAPIFDGSGMKTKVAEALMFGRRVIATPEALVGYEAVAGDIGSVCSSASDFVVALDNEVKGEAARFDARLRGIYEAHYSYPAAKARLAAIIDDTDTSSLVRRT